MRNFSAGENNIWDEMMMSTLYLPNIRTHYSDSEPTSLLTAYWRSSKYLYQFFSLWLDQAGSWTHDPWNIKHVGNHFVANIYVYIVFSRVKSDLSDQIYTMDQFEIFVQILCEEFLETNKENIEVVLRCLNWHKLFSTSTYS